jgi:hypothetical protein
MKITLALISLFIASAFSQDSLPAPFGLKWGAPISSFKCNKIDTLAEKNILVCKTDKVPKNIPTIEKYMLVISYNFGLMKVVALGVDIGNDTYGGDGKKRYNEFKDLLTIKYGNPTSTYEYIGAKVYTDSDEFYQCLKYDGCGSMASFWKIGDATIMLSLEGLDRGLGFVNIVYESQLLNKHSEIVKKEENAKLQDGL